MHAVRRLVALLAVTLAAGCGTRGEPYESADGRFTVWLPGVPTTASDPDLPRSVRKVSFVERSGSYSVAWEDLSAVPPDAEVFLDAASDRAVKALKGKERSRKVLYLGEVYPGRELVVDWPERTGMVHHRMYLVGGRLYHVSVSGPGWWVESATAKKVFASFALREP